MWQSSKKVFLNFLVASSDMKFSEPMFLPWPCKIVAEKLMGCFWPSLIHGKLLKVTIKTLKATSGFLFCPTKRILVSTLEQEHMKVSLCLDSGRCVPMALHCLWKTTENAKAIALIEILGLFLKGKGNGKKTRKRWKKTEEYKLLAILV